MREEWRDVSGWEEVYQISSHGRLKSFRGDKTGRILSNRNGKGDYLRVVLGSGMKTREHESTYIHRLVAGHFLPPQPSPRHQVNHIDGNKQNNRADNLEWLTPSENMKHISRIKPEFLNGVKRYNKNLRPKGIIQFDLDGRFIRTFPNASEAENATGVCRRNICQVAVGTEYKPGMTRRQAGGFIWKRVVELSMEETC